MKKIEIEVENEDLKENLIENIKANKKQKLKNNIILVINLLLTFFAFPYVIMFFFKIKFFIALLVYICSNLIISFTYTKIKKAIKSKNEHK